MESNETAEEKKSSGLKIFLSIIFFLFVTFSLVIYWFVPYNSIEFKSASQTSNFSISNTTLANMQFYPNLRFASSNISYKIEDCPLQKQDDMRRAFEIVSNITLLNFYSVPSGEEIIVNCESKNRIENGLFIAGEGGPVNITKTDKFNIISHGQILLIRQSRCPKPNVGIHELLHVLGFDHSINKNNIMYNISSCRHTIGDDIPELINEIYSVPGYPDLAIENVSAQMHGKYLDLNLTVKNHGLKKSSPTKLAIYADEKLLKEFDVEEIDLGYGKIISLSNLWVSKINVKELKINLGFGFKDLDKENNEVILKIK